MVIQGKIFAASILEYQLVFRGVEAGARSCSAFAVLAFFYQAGNGSSWTSGSADEG